jgi:hypothetical protein
MTYNLKQREYVARKILYLHYEQSRRTYCEKQTAHNK